MNKQSNSTPLLPPLRSVLLIVFLISAAPAQTQTCPLPGQLPTRLEPNIRARVEPGPGTPNNLRDAPGLDGAVIGQIPPGGQFVVLDGPQCADGYVWWQVDYEGTMGWTAEGNTERYWLEPLTQPVDLALAEGKETAFCLEPPDDYTIIDFDYARLNSRTMAMLDHASAIYHALGGLLSFNFSNALVQGSYNAGQVAASFGTHDGGGAVDLSVREPVSRRVMAEEIPALLRALRIAGFAAWLRDTDELYPSSPIHIHAIAIGDAELSPAAREQIDGPFGYLHGYNGLPQDSGIPLPDTSGDMVICPWMIALGFDDLRQLPSR